MSLNASGESSSDTTYIEFNDLLCRAGWENKVAEALAEHIRDQKWDELVLAGFSRGAAYETLRTAFGGLVCEEVEHPCHYVDLAEIRRCGKTYDTVLKGRSRKHLRQNIRYYSSLGEVRLEAARDLQSALVMFDQVADLSQKRWAGKGKNSVLSSSRFRAFHRSILMKCFGQGTVQMLRATAGRETIGVIYNLVFRGKVYFYQCGYQYTADKRLGPGKAALSLAIQYCLDAGYDDFDFLSGEAKYKESMATGSRSLVWTTFRKPGIRFRILDALRWIKTTA
jgi:CelD/BcsL family acetyltransferase involved in cellulose biosynthesis